MTSAKGNFLISFPFGQRHETVNSSRYRWDGTQRGTSEFVIIQRTSRGEGLFERDGKAWPVPAEHAFIALVPEQSVYSFPPEAADPWSFSWINLYGALAIAICREFRAAFDCVLPLPAHSAAGAMYLQLVERAEARRFLDPYESSAACYAFLMEWARQLAHPARQQSDPVDTAIALCASRFREPLGVKELAAATGLTREHFTRLFTQRTGRAPARYLRDLRLAAAREMLSNQKPPFKEAALRCGFPSDRSLRHALEGRS